MKYTLYRALDMRDGKPMLWLTRGVFPDRELALFTGNIEPAAIKRKTAVAAEAITWEPTDAWYKHAAIGGAKLIDKWEFNG